MHNRARLVVGSFLTKDLGIDWRWGERHFMRLLLDGDEANNNGNWQWIASVGTDPQPPFRRIYNPARHQERYDPDGGYVRRYVPELERVPDEHLREPWRMPAEVQRAGGLRDRRATTPSRSSSTPRPARRRWLDTGRPPPASLRGSVAAIEIQGISKRFGEVQAVKDLSFEVQAGPRHRFPRPQRSRQEHDDPDAAGPGPPRRRPRHLRRARVRGPGAPERSRRRGARGRELPPRPQRAQPPAHPGGCRRPPVARGSRRCWS